MMKRSIKLGLAIALILGSACASRTLNPLDEVKPLPQDLPKDLLTKFEVEGIQPSPSPSPSPSASPSPEPKKKTAAKPKPEPKKGKAAKAFVYPSRRPAVDPIWVGEKMTLEITYFGAAAGEFTTEVLPFKSINGRKVYHLKGMAKTSSVFALFYRLDDWLESYLDYDGLFSHRFHLVLDQTRQKRDALELFDSEKKQVFYWNRRDHVEKGYSESKDYLPMVPFPQDSFSALYYVRTLPLEVGQVYNFPVVSEGKGWEAVVTVLRKEIIETPLGKRTPAIVVRPQTKYQGVLRQKRGDSLVWISDDEKRYILRLEAEVKVGTVVARLKKVEPGEKPE